MTPQTMKGELARQNDEFRQAVCTRWRPHEGKLMLTRGVSALRDLISEILDSVATFGDFTEDNDPYGEHDFGAFEVDDVRLFWKIDYYDVNYEFGSDEPADPTKTRRVLTIMLAEEY